MLKICIIGGGTAGWMAAGYIESQIEDVEITLIESQSVPTIGVGESTLPQVKTFFNTIGISKDIWVNECDAIVKEGNSKHNWNDPDSDEDYLAFTFWFNDDNIFDKWVDGYFNEQYDKHQINNDLYYARDRSQFQHSSYHLNAEKIPNVIKNHCKKVIHVYDTVESLPKGFDYYLLCTGPSKKLVKDKTLFDISTYHKVNRAWVAPLHIRPNTEVDKFTRSVARKHGWQFYIDTSNKTGTGYVFSNEFVDEDDALVEFYEYLEKDKRTTIHEPNLLRWNPGWLKEAWQTTEDGEVIAIGLANGFIDPLESNALFMIQYTATAFVDSLKKRNPKKVYNRALHKLWYLNSTYIRLHYLLARRNDSNFWKYYKQFDINPFKKELWENYKLRSNKYTNLWPDAVWATTALYFDVWEYYVRNNK